MNTLSILINGDISSSDVHKAHALAERRLGCSSIRLLHENPSLAFDVPTALSLASAIAAIASLLLSVVQAWSDKRAAQEWTADKFKSHITTQLLKLGVTSFKVVSIENFETIIKKDEGPCVVEIVDEDGERITMIISNHKNNFSIDVERCKPRKGH